MVSPARGLGNKLLFTELGRAGRLRVPTLCPNRPLLGEGNQRSSDNHVSLPTMAGSTLVPPGAGNGIRRSDDFTSISSSTNIRHRTDSSHARDWPDSNRLAVVRGRLAMQGFSGAVVELLLDGTRKSTGTAYQAAWVLGCVGVSKEVRIPCRRL